MTVALNKFSLMLPKVVPEESLEACTVGTELKVSLAHSCADVEGSGSIFGAIVVMMQVEA